MEETRHMRPVATRILVILIGGISLILLYGGGALLELGGTSYYLVSGIALAGTALLLWRRDGRAATVYGLFLILSVAWALYESGLDGWALAARLVAPGVLGIFLLVPRVLAELNAEARKLGTWTVGAGLGAITLAFGSAAFSRDNAILTLPTAQTAFGDAAASRDWQNYGGTPSGTRFSPADQITASNVHELKVAWTYRTGTLSNGTLAPFEATPLMINNKLYLCGHNGAVMALDSASGHELWRYDPHVEMTASTKLNPLVACRGVAYAEVEPSEEGAKVKGAQCARRIISPTADARLIAVDADNGRACGDFGRGGTINLRDGLGEVKPGYYHVSSAPAVIGGNIVVGGLVLDNQSTDEPSGVIRAFEVRTGRLAWAWDIGRPDRTGMPPAGQSYTRSTPNSWAPISVDPRLGLIYVPMGNSTPDHWGAFRSAPSEAYASSLVALDAATGRARWHFQITHHDVWDYDVASQPVLVDIPGSNGVTPAVVQATKTGQIFVLDRRNGRPLKRVVEKSVPQGPAEGDWLSPTQPFSIDMPHFGGDRLRESDMWGMTPLDQLWCRIQFRKLRYEGMYTPPSVTGSLVSPGVGGGMNWGSVTVDPQRSVVLTNANLVPHIVRLIPRSRARGATKGITGGGAGEFNDVNVAEGTPFQVVRTGFTSPLKMPCIKPPFGVISAINLKTGKTLWSRPLGSGRDAGPLGIPSNVPLPIGTPNQGGSIVTRSGLVFIGATQERTFRALDLKTGQELWQARLPAAANATPMTYIASNGRQYVLVAAGGYPPFDPGHLGDYLVAFALPR